MHPKALVLKGVRRRSKAGSPPVGVPLVEMCRGREHLMVWNVYNPAPHGTCLKSRSVEQPRRLTIVFPLVLFCTLLAPQSVLTSFQRQRFASLFLIKEPIISRVLHRSEHIAQPTFPICPESTIYIFLSAEHALHFL